MNAALFFSFFLILISIIFEIAGIVYPDFVKVDLVVEKFGFGLIAVCTLNEWKCDSAASIENAGKILFLIIKGFLCLKIFYYIKFGFLQHFLWVAFR